MSMPLDVYAFYHASQRPECQRNGIHRLTEFGNKALVIGAKVRVKDGAPLFRAYPLTHFVDARVIN